MADKEGLASKFGHWSALYAAFLFLAGWSYLRGYFRTFGMDTSWLELGLNDTISRGFSVLFGTGVYLSIIYLAVFLISMLVEVYSENRIRWLEAAIPALLVIVMFPLTHVVAGLAGIKQANIDRGDHTSLPSVTFLSDSCSYIGKLVYEKGDLLYVHNLKYLDTSKAVSACPIVLTDPLPIPQLWLLRSEGLKDVRVIHYEKEAKP